MGGLPDDVGEVLVNQGRRRDARVGECAEPLQSFQLRHTPNEQRPFRRFSYDTGISLMSPGEPPMNRMQFHDKVSIVKFWLQVTGT